MRAHAQSHFWAVKLTCDSRVIHFDYTLEQLSMDEKRNVQLEVRN